MSTVNRTSQRSTTPATETTQTPTEVSAPAQPAPQDPTARPADDRASPRAAGDTGTAAEDAGLLSQVPAKVAERLSQLIETMGALGSEESALGDLDLDITEDEMLGLVGPQYREILTKIGAIFAHGSVDEQNEVIDFINAWAAVVSEAQQQGAQELFGMPMEAMTERLQTVIAFVTAAIDSPAQPEPHEVPEPVVTELGVFLGSADDVDVNALVQWVLRESYMETTNDLRFYAEKVRFYNDVKRQIREELTRARKVRSEATGLDETASLSQIYNPVDVQTTYTGSALTSGQSALTQEEEALSQEELDRRQYAEDVQTRYDAAKTAYENLPPNTTSVSFPQIVGHGNNNSNKIHDSDTAEVMMQGAGQAWIDDLVGWFNTLPPEQQAALVEKWKTEGLRFIGYARETQARDQRGHYNQTKVMGEHDDPATWLAEEAKRCIEGTASDLAGNDAGKKNKLADYNFRVDIGHIQVETPADKPQDLIHLEGEMDALGLHVGSESSALQNDGIIDTVSELDAYIKAKEEKLSSVGDDAQLANVDLQNILQKQQQTLQMMSNISKMMHDTAMAVVRKIGG